MDVLIAHFDRLETFDSFAGITEGSKPINTTTFAGTAVLAAAATQQGYFC